VNKPSNQKVIIITGASSGIGAATARRLARDGARLTLAARRLDKLKQVADEAQALGGEVLVVQADVRRREEIQQMVDATLKQWGRIDVLLNNAGVGYDTILVSMPPERIRDEIAINLTAVIECTQAVLSIMLRQKSGHVINVASIAGLIGLPGSVVYSATKFGVNGFSDALRREIRGKGVRISAFCPGYTPTELSPALKAIAEGRPGGQKVPGMMPVEYVAGHIARLIAHPRLRVIIPLLWSPLPYLASLFPAIADGIVPFFRAR
jgi:3-oxoacyl-[acyl-carrier protein] reductase